MSKSRASNRIPDWTKLTFPCEVRTLYNGMTYTGIMSAPNVIQTQEDGKTVELSMSDFVGNPRKSATSNKPNAWLHIQYKSGTQWKSIDTIRKTPIKSEPTIVATAQAKPKPKKCSKQQPEPKVNVARPKKIADWTKITYPCPVRVIYCGTTLTGQLIKENTITTSDVPGTLSLYGFASILPNKAKKENGTKSEKNAWTTVEYKDKDQWRSINDIREEPAQNEIVYIAPTTVEPKVESKNEAAPKKKSKKDTIPKNVRDLCWYTWIGKDIASAKCVCCERIEIRMTAFECGHVIAESKGGSISVDNLRPICSACNRSMASENLADFKKRCGFGPLMLTPVPPVPIRVPQPDNNTEPLSKRRKELPTQIQRRVWNTHVGINVAVDRCRCCEEGEINNIKFAVGFLQDAHEGGTLKVDNLRPICEACDESIGSMSINEYASTYFK